MPTAIVAIAAHRDDVELTCGGTLARAAGQGHRTAIVDLTRGEMGTRGTAEIREREVFAVIHRAQKVETPSVVTSSTRIVSSVRKGSP